ncbi:MAG: MFS transporter [Chloroflexota bacterium]|nr:MFS transporter [Chloroflexota bacterium]
MSDQDSTRKRDKYTTEPGPVGPSMGVNAPNAAAATAETPPVLEETPRRSSPWVALKYRDFRLLWMGGFVSQTGSQMRIVAIGVQLWDLTHDPFALGLLGVFKLVPLLLLSLFGGVIADSFDRRSLLLMTQGVFAVTSVLLAVSTQFGWISPAIIYGVSALSAATTAFDNPARSAFVPSLVERRHLPNALSLNIIVWQVATIIGPTLGGVFLFLGSVGFVIIYWIDAVSFGAVMVALGLMHARAEKGVKRDVSMKAALDGLRFLRKMPIIMSTMTLDFFATFFGAAMVLLPPFAETVLKVDRLYWGVLYAAPAVGALVAGLVMSWVGNVNRQGLLVIVSVMAYGAATVVFGLSGTFWLAVLGLAGTGAADTVSMVMRQTIRQLNTPDELRGRMTSVNMLFYIGGPQLGEVEAGIAAALIGFGPSIALGGAAVIVVAGLTAYLVPSLREYRSVD